MRNIFCRSLLPFILLLISNCAQSQPDQFAYAVTAVNKDGHEWIALRKLDTHSGEFSNILLNLADRSQAFIGLPQAANSGIAAIAYDRRTNRLYYIPMNADQLHSIDLSTMKMRGVSDRFSAKTGKPAAQPSAPITRLVIAPDGYGYTITNDGDHLLRYSTDETPILTDLGELVDDPLNNEMTIHNPCANAGGDLIADDAGHLYLINAANKVFKVDIATRKTSFVAAISGLPAQFTTNGAAVDENGKIIVGSSLYTDAYFTVDPRTWTAASSPTAAAMYGSADLANSNVLLTNEPGGVSLFIKKAGRLKQEIKVFPNPVLFDEVNVQFNGLPPGTYTIQLASALGRIVLQQKATILQRSQTEVIHIPGFTAQGFYYIQIMDQNNAIVSTQKLAVERW